jgi:hypothetical protein
MDGPTAWPANGTIPAPICSIESASISPKRTLKAAASHQWSSQTFIPTILPGYATPTRAGGSRVAYGPWDGSPEPSYSGFSTGSRTALGK